MAREPSIRFRAQLFVAAFLACAFFVAANAATADAAYPTGKNGRIAYQVYDGQFDVFSMLASGAEQTNLTSAPGSYEVNATYSPNGRKIAFVRDVGLGTDIYVMNTDGSGAVNLTNTPGVFEFNPAYSPDGRTIVFNDEEEEPVVDLYAINADGSGRRSLTNTAVPGGPREAHADFSPDGRRIAFDICSGPNCDIYTMAPDGSDVRNLTNTPAVLESDPAYSPDGRRIAYSSGAYGGIEVAVMNADGTGPTRVTANDLFETAPVFSPDGRRIAFTANPDGEDTEVMAVSALAPGPLTNITNNSIRDEGADWQSLQRCAGRPVTIMGDDGPDKIKGTKKADVIAAFAGKDTILGLGGSDRICAGKGKDKIVGGGGRKDLCRGQQGKDKGFKGCERGKL
jgi:dipeptidyl aminopeptidase/acylaminoacyl peptidase